MSALPPSQGQRYRWRFGRVEFDEARLELRVGGQPVEVEQKPLQVLAVLLHHVGEVVTKRELLDAVWAGLVTVEHVLATAVGKLRKALGEDAEEDIVTVAAGEPGPARRLRPRHRLELRAGPLLSRMRIRRREPAGMGLNRAPCERLPGGAGRPVPAGL
jgi:eukaryotic-like serine/threonine-protein kinase